MYTPGGGDQRWHPDVILGEDTHWVGGLMYAKLRALCLSVFKKTFPPGLLYSCTLLSLVGLLFMGSKGWNCLVPESTRPNLRHSHFKTSWLSRHGWKRGLRNVSMGKVWEFTNRL